MRKKSLLSNFSKEEKERARLNPEFLGIGKEYVQTHNQRKNIQLEEKHVSNRVTFLQKEHQVAQKKMQKKQNELERLMSIIARKEADDDERERLRRERQDTIARQRQQNMKKRNEHQSKLRNAYLSLYDEARDASDSMRRTFNNYENLRQSMKLNDLNNKKERVMSISMDKSQGKKKIDSFYKTKNDYFTYSYKERIRQEKEVANHTSAKISNLSTVENDLRLKLENSSSKLSELEQKYYQTYRNRLQSNKSFHLGPNSKSYYMKNSRTLETKEDAGRQFDPKIDNFIEKQL